MSAEQVDYRTTAGTPAAAVDEAKATCRAAGRRVKTVARIRGVPGAYIVTLAVEAQA